MVRYGLLLSALLVMACTTEVAPSLSSTQSTPLTLGEAVTRYNGLALCTKEQSCAPKLFAKAHPDGVSGCVDYLLSIYTKSGTENSVAPCSEAQMGACSSEYAALSCRSKSTSLNASDPSGFLPAASSPTCSMCGYGE